MTQGIDYNAKTIEDARIYMDYRSVQLRTLGYFEVDKHVLTESGEPIGLHYNFKKGTEKFYGVYILHQFRNQGKFREIVNEIMKGEDNLQVITMKDCNLETYLVKKEIPHLCVDTLPEYKVIERYYGDTRAKRSKVLYMNHINEGLIILDAIEASIFSKKAYCLHPIFQVDSDLKTNYRREFHQYSKEDIIDSQSIILAMEYRHIANAYLSDRELNSLDDVQLSPLREVQEMLIADKVQNYKDFIKYHSYSHERRRELYDYFHNWFELLNINKNVKSLLSLIEKY